MRTHFPLVFFLYSHTKVIPSSPCEKKGAVRVSGRVILSLNDEFQCSYCRYIVCKRVIVWVYGEIEERQEFKRLF